MVEDRAMMHTYDEHEEMEMDDDYEYDNDEPTVSDLLPVIAAELPPMVVEELHLSTALQASFESLITDQTDREMDSAVLRRSCKIACMISSAPTKARRGSMPTNGTPSRRSVTSPTMLAGKRK